MAGEKKYFVLLDDDNQDTETVFHSRQPRGAALKASSRGFDVIRLRERGTNRVHVFKGWREQVPVPTNAPKWVGGGDGKVWKANVKKQGVEHL
jgi:hypothetical protein